MKQSMVVVLTKTHLDTHQWYCLTSSGAGGKTRREQAVRPHDVAMMMSAGRVRISMKSGLESRLPARLQGRAPARTTPRPVPRTSSPCCCDLDYTQDCSALPTTSSSSFHHQTHQPLNPNNPNKPHQHFTMATLSCTFLTNPLARAGDDLENTLFVVTHPQLHYLEDIAAVPYSSHQPH